MPRPKWKIEEAIRTGVGIQELAHIYREKIEPRVASGVIDGLGDDVAALRDDTSGVAVARAVRQAATATQNEAIERGAMLVSSVRAAIRRAHPDDASLQKDFGVGVKVQAGSVGSAAAGLSTIIEAAGRHADELRAAGVLPSDIHDAQALLAALVGADTGQEGKKITAKEATARRIATHLRVEAGVDTIVAAAMTAFRDQPAILQRFTSLLPSRRRKKAPAREPEPVT